MLIWFSFNKNCKPSWDDRWYVRYINTHSSKHSTNPTSDNSAQEIKNLFWEWTNHTKFQTLLQGHHILLPEPFSYIYVKIIISRKRGIIVIPPKSDTYA